MPVTLATNCWEKDWKYLLLDGYLERMISNCDYHFAHRLLCIGNVRNLDKVRKAADKKIRNGVIDNYIVTEPLSNEVLSFFEIEKESFHGGYGYSIAPLTSIYTCPTDLLLYFTGDSHLTKDNNQWVRRASEMMASSPDYFVANPHDDYELSTHRCISECDSHFTSFWFSDQCFLVRTADFKRPIYNEKHPTSEEYPKYAGDSFEKRVDSFMRNHNLLRATYKDAVYVHENYRRWLTRHFFPKRK